MTLRSQPFSTLNPQNFKLRIAWTVDGTSKMVAEFSSSNWLPRIGETLVLPIDEADKSNFCRRWHKFRVFDIVYDFQYQVVRVLCTPVGGLTSLGTASLISKIQKPKNSWEVLENAITANEARMKAELVEPTFSPISEKYEDDELEKLRVQLNDL
jgi:hypothetical protein